MTTYDVIIVGAGAGGGIAAGVLAEAGKRVLLLERGHDYTFEQIGRDHLRNHRLSQYGQNTGPDPEGNPRVAVDATGRETIALSFQGAYHNNAMAVGGGTRVFGAQAWRFLPDDFRMASRYGVPAGSSLADWPFDYSELAPYYQQAEWEVGVAGDSERAAEHWPRERGFPMPAVPYTTEGRALADGAGQLGWKTMAPPLLINTTPYLGRPACIECQHCVGFGCPVDAKNGSRNTLIERALASGRCTLETEAMVTNIDTDASGTVVGVTYVRDGNIQQARAAVVVVAAGAIESARLLLCSRSPQHPNGLGNQHDQVGRNLQGHYYPRASGLTPEPVYTGQGPGVCISTLENNHNLPGVIGGGMLANEFVVLPIIFWKRFLPPDTPRWGQAAKDMMREGYRRYISITGPVQEIPSPDARVTISDSVRDHLGMPVARLSGATHPETVRTASVVLERAKQWLRATGVVELWGKEPTLGLSGGQHQAGTCRMGENPHTSVCDPWGRVHGHDNLFITDGSLNVTNGGFNPVLTIMALAFRTARHIAAQ